MWRHRPFAPGCIETWPPLYLIMYKEFLHCSFYLCISHKFRHFTAVYFIFLILEMPEDKQTALVTGTLFLLLNFPNDKINLHRIEEVAQVSAADC